ncbi:hypothetical protein [Asanoa iriomotensis]|uniref:hypothetical protein n=1 Tax=Asanoa iriomotensis TaxID=234613 RepID=UPI0019424FD2|nr:hypothetical protein [Asanoa iriomotensis]
MRLLVIAPDGDEFILGRNDLGVYVAVPEPGAVFVRALQDGCSLADATARAGATAGAEVNGGEFLDGLRAAGLLDRQRAGGTSQTAESADGDGRSIRWFEGISPRTARVFFGRPAWALYVGAAVAAAMVLATRPALRPSYSHVWWLPDPLLSLVTYVLLGFVLAALHEVWHWLAGRSAGVPAAFRISRRGAYLVFETDLSQIVTVNRTARYGPFLAGMAFDVTVLAGALAARAAYGSGVVEIPPSLDRLLAAVVLALVIGIVWQWSALFLRSDGYAVLANALRCHNLFRATVLTTKWRIWGLSGEEAAEFGAIGPRDRAVARWFGLVYLLGMIGTLWAILIFALPFLLSTGAWVSANLAAYSLSSVAFWESLAVLVYLVAGVVGPAVIAWRERRLRRAGALL